MHTVNYTVMRTGSRLFDDVIIAAAKRICAELTGLRCQVTPTEVHISGALNDADYARYEKFMFGEAEGYYSQG